MEISGEQLIHASQRDVWTELNNPLALKACVPGCEIMDRVSDHEFRIEMLSVVGPVKARFKGALTLSDVDAPNRYVLSFDGSGGAAGFAKGSAAVSLSPDGGGTRLVYRAQAHVGGKLAQIGSRLVDGVAKRTAAEFFARFTARFEPAVPAAAAEGLAVAVAASADEGPVQAAAAGPEAVSRARPGRLTASMRWVVTGIVLLIAASILYLLNRS